ncbi:MAG: hypothetical protein COT24_04700 [Candidatus Kerfeldbacteria bacterium CG08_land_8_20_14_0_20_40_16]|uniref:Carotenoid oxygenase n=1 Tax=Candidatus Kerfeldbacteria bacterium CG08_land_8_20_14_0_20_40_16 TaxID=2014244 RepID=A0A2H0YWW0_9BACT|nr:MAG: hypothetical protein COT24_04700 [Candidatus Kerfeldbacteria bacterium CG08_land_8_20_14_0_20_40_16]
MSPKPIFLFDFDGVIVDTLNEAHLTFNRLFKTLQLKPAAKEEVRSMYNKNIHDALLEYGVKEKDFKKLWSMIKAREKGRTNRVSLYPSINLLLQSLKNYHLYIISASATAAVKSYLKRKKLLNYFQGVQGAEEGLSKIDKIEKIIKREKTSPQKTYFLTDTVGDVLEGKKTDVKIIGVAWGYHKYRELKAVSPDYLFKTPGELIKAIPKLCKNSK